MSAYCGLGHQESKLNYCILKKQTVCICICIGIKLTMMLQQTYLQKLDYITFDHIRLWKFDSGQHNHTTGNHLAPKLQIA